MTNFLAFNPESYYLFFLVVLRISGIFVTAPILSSENVPRSVKLYLAVICSLILFSALPATDIKFGLFNTIDYFLLAFRELMIGLLLGFIPRMMFAAVDFAGTLVGFMMGLSIANVVDPQTDLQVSIIASLEGLIATLLFIVLDGHHIFLQAISYSYQYVPVGGFLFTTNKMDFILRAMGDVVIIGLKLGAPLVVALLLANVIMGFMARSIPQMNVFIVGFPFTIGLGFILLILGMPHLVRAMSMLFGKVGEQVIQLIQMMPK
ncbi:MAG: flagellar biosynthetic protein FliR [Proteobacteria bacterium]|nr:flagellar biosynthetic protein FliR [Pseudomonadota bacterium]